MPGDNSASAPLLWRDQHPPSRIDAGAMPSGSRLTAPEGVTSSATAIHPWTRRFVDRAAEQAYQAECFADLQVLALLALLVVLMLRVQYVINFYGTEHTTSMLILALLQLASAAGCTVLVGTCALVHRRAVGQHRAAAVFVLRQHGGLGRIVHWWIVTGAWAIWMTITIGS